MHKVICNYLYLNAGNASGSAAHSCLLHIQLSLPCSDSQHKKMTTLHTKHTTPNTTLHTNNTLQTPTPNVTNRSTLKTRHLCRCLHHRLRPSHNFLFLNNQTCCLDTFLTKARIYRFFLHQTQSKRDGNVREKVWRTLFTLSLVSDVPVRPVRRLGRWVG